MRMVIVIIIAIFSNFPLHAQWQQTNGPLGGGDFTSLVVFGDTVLAATQAHGIFISFNQGASWADVSFDFSTTWPVTFFKTDVYLYIGTGVGIWRSPDGGLTWEEANSGLPYYSTVVAFAQSDTVLYVATGIGSIFKSTDNGSFWQTVYTGLPSISSLLIRENKILAGSYSNGVMISTDGGASWKEVNSGLTNLFVQTLTQYGNTIYTGTLGGGVYKSINNGSSWTAVNTGLPDLDVDKLVISGNYVVAATRGGVFRSGNNGISWTGINNGLPANVWMMSLAADGPSLFTGLEHKGVYASANSGNYWQAAGGLPFTDVTALVVFDSVLFAGTSGHGLFKTSCEGDAWVKTGNAIPEWVAITSLGANQNNLFAGTYNGVFRSADAGNSWTNLLNGPQVTSLAVNGASILAGVYYGGVYLSSNNGDTWTQPNQGLPIRPINAIAFKGSVLFAGTEGNGIYRSMDQGNSWIPVNSGLTNQIITCLLVKANKIFAGTYGGGIFVSNNNGGLWTQVNSGEIHALFSYETKLFAGKVNGVEISLDTGSTWIPLDEGEAPYLVTSFAYDGRYLYAGTKGRSVYRNSTILAGLEEKVPKVPFITIYPNPGNSIITFATGDETGNGHLNVYDMSGREVLGHYFIDGRGILDIRNLPAGVYAVRYSSPRGSITGKFVKEKNPGF